jgi:hypothetical protein
MKKWNQRIPTLVKTSWIALAIAIAGTIPMVLWTNDPRSSEPRMYIAREAFDALACISLIAIPASAFSLLSGLFAINKSKLAYISIVPALGFLLYSGFIFLRVFFPWP